MAAVPIVDNPPNNTKAHFIKLFASAGCALAPARVVCDLGKGESRFQEILARRTTAFWILMYQQPFDGEGPWMRYLRAKYKPNHLYQDSLKSCIAAEGQNP